MEEKSNSDARALGFLNGSSSNNGYSDARVARALLKINRNRTTEFKSVV